MDISGDESLFCNRGRAGKTFSGRGESDDSEDARAQIEMKGEFIGIREMRKHVAWYTAGCPTVQGFVGSPIILRVMRIWRSCWRDYNYVQWIRFCKNHFKCSVDQMSGKPLYGDKR